MTVIVIDDPNWHDCITYPDYILIKKYDIPMNVWMPVSVNSLFLFACCCKNKVEINAVDYLS